MPRPVVASLFYLGVVLLGLGLIAVLNAHDPDVVSADGKYLLALPVLHIAFGWVVQRWWAPLLPLAFFIAWWGIVTPCDPETEEFTCEFLIIAGIVGTISVGFGVGARRLARRLRR
jgi:hypothetical protein